MFKDELKNFVLENPKLVKMNPAGDGIFVLKYSKRVFYDNLWNEYIAECRGTIVDADFNVISRPFTKIYNYGIEKEAPVLSDDTEVLAFRKVNGFMVAMTWYNGDILVSTTGSTANDYVDYAKEMMLSHQSWADWQLAFNRSDMDGMTVMFEAVHGLDPHIIPETEGLHLLGYRENVWGSKVGYNPEVLDAMADMFNCHKVEHVSTTVGDLKQMAKVCKHEGFVAYTEDGTSFKIKSPYYLVQKALARKKDILSLNKELVEEEYYPLVNHLLEIKDHFNSLSEQDRLEYIRTFLSK
jgi:hypothetical protein